MVSRVSTHSRPKAAGKYFNSDLHYKAWFQHTAARRRLAVPEIDFTASTDVSTHSRPKAAGLKKAAKIIALTRFNTQPPEGGWLNTFIVIVIFVGFQHTAARRRLDMMGFDMAGALDVSTHSRPKAAGP